MADGSPGQLRRHLDYDRITIVPGVTNAFDAKIAQRAGFDALFLTGAGVANCQLGAPDLGLTTMSEVVTTVYRIVHAVGIPVIADADVGFGGSLNVVRTTRELENAGAAGLIIEDQEAAKRCGHFDGKRVVDTGTMVARIVAAHQARRDQDFVIIARTDSLATHGLTEALRRAEVYARAGADMIFVEAPESLDDLAAIPRDIGSPCLVNMVEDGRTPLMSARELEEMGYAAVLFANLALRASARAVHDALTSLRQTGSSAAVLDRIYSWSERQTNVELDQWQQLETEIASQVDEVLIQTDGLRTTNSRNSITPSPNTRR